MKPQSKRAVVRYGATPPRLIPGKAFVQLIEPEIGKTPTGQVIVGRWKRFSSGAVVPGALRGGSAGFAGAGAGTGGSGRTQSAGSIDTHSGALAVPIGAVLSLDPPPGGVGVGRVSALEVSWAGTIDVSYLIVSHNPGDTSSDASIARY